MKRTKKLTYEQKKLLSQKGYNPEEFRFVMQDKFALLFVNTKTNENIWVEHIG